MNEEYDTEKPPGNLGRAIEKLFSAEHIYKADKRRPVAMEKEYTVCPRDQHQDLRRHPNCQHLFTLCRCAALTGYWAC